MQPVLDTVAVPLEMVQEEACWATLLIKSRAKEVDKLQNRMSHNNTCCLIPYQSILVLDQTVHTTMKVDRLHRNESNIDGRRTVRREHSGYLVDTEGTVRFDQELQQKI